MNVNGIIEIIISIITLDYYCQQQQPPTSSSHHHQKKKEMHPRIIIGDHNSSVRDAISTA